jgi:hypothetical protein
VCAPGTWCPQSTPELDPNPNPNHSSRTRCRRFGHLDFRPQLPLSRRFSSFFFFLVASAPPTSSSFFVVSCTGSCVGSNAAPVHDVWSCPQCEETQLSVPGPAGGGDGVCSACGTERRWRCAACSFDNPHSAVACDICGGTQRVYGTVEEFETQRQLIEGGFDDAATRQQAWKAEQTALGTERCSGSGRNSGSERLWRARSGGAPPPVHDVWGAVRSARRGSSD